MAKFTNCLQIVNAMPEQDQDALLARLDELQARGMSPKEAQLQAAIDVLAQVEREGQMRKSPPRLSEDIPNESWLQGKIDYAERKGRNQWGVPTMSTVTGYFDKPVEVSLRVLSRLKGERDEQNNVREESLKYIRKNWDEVSQQPPYIEVAYNGEAWISEGNHRIMVAAEKGLESMPVEIRYFDGGQRRNGPLSPSRIPSLEDADIRKSADSVTDTPAFKRWFGDSKVVDAAGKPLVFYHGGQDDFTGIKGRGRFGGAIFVREGAPSGYGSAQHALYVRGPILELDQMADALESAEGNNVLAKALPSNVEDDARAEVAQALTDGSHYPTSESVWEAIGAIDEADAQVEIQTLRGKVARALGYGAVRTPDEFDGQTVMILDPTQIKSATGNNGEFNPASPDIRKSPERTWSGDGYRALNYNPPKNATVADVVRYESEELGNEDIGEMADESANDLGVDLSSIPASDAIWVTRTAEQAMEYGDRSDIKKYPVDGWLILTDLGDEGALLLNPKHAQGARKSPERDANFKRWFGDSKVVDAKGKPLVVYHATDEKFDEFYVGQYGSHFGSKDAAIFRANELDGDDVSLLPVYLSIQNPLRLRDPDGGDWAQNENDNGALDQMVALGLITKSEAATISLKKAVERAGYDGVVYDNAYEGGGDSYIVFRPEQIKSATGNSGQFDPSSNDIRKSRERDANFKRWSGGAPVIKLGDNHEFRSGEPVVVEALHGTTNADLTEFKRSRANIESDMGAGFYASNTPEDVAANYANNDGADLTNKRERLTEQIYQQLEDDEEWSDRTHEEREDEAIRRANERLSDGAPNTLKLYMRFKNPVVLGDNETYLDYSDSYDEEIDEYGEPEGKLVDFVEELRITAPVFGVSGREIETALGRISEEAEGEGVRASVLHDIIENEFIDAYDENGNSVSREIFRQVLSEIGFDGVIDTTVNSKWGRGRDRVGMKGMTPDTVHFIAFEPEQIKSATGNSGEFGENRNILRSVDRPQFYSQLQRAIEGVPDRLSNMGAMGWKQWIDSNGPKLGVKKEEIEWSGIKDYLDLQGKAKLSKDDLSAYLDDSGVKISEVVLGAPDYSEVEAWWEDEGGANEETPFSELSEQEKAEAAERYADEVGEYSESTPTPKYGQYTLPGGSNYREVLITLPESQDSVRRRKDFDAQLASAKSESKGLSDQIEQLEFKRAELNAASRQELERRFINDALAEDVMFMAQAEMRRNPDSELTLEMRLQNARTAIAGDRVEFPKRIERYKQRFLRSAASMADADVDAKLGEIDRQLFDLRSARARLVSRTDAMRPPKSDGYKSSHWDQKNVLAHIRVNDRTDADGKRVLFVEEIQSDWGQEGKKKGFIGGKVKGYQVQFNGRPVMTYETRQEADAHVERAKGFDKEAPVSVVEVETTRHSVNERAEGKVLNAPFVTKTEGWLNLALKRIMVMAAEGGYDKVAFVNGEQSAERYDLSKQVDKITIGKAPSELGKWQVVARKDGEVAIDRFVSSDDELASLIGKDLAEKAVAKNGGSYSGLDLKVGGEGMKTFYDQIVPQALNKLLPKLGGEKIGPVVFGGEDVGGRYVVFDEDSGERLFRTDNRKEANEYRLAYSGDAVIKEVDGNAGVGLIGEQPGFDVTDKMRETVGAGLPLFSRDRRAMILGDLGSLSNDEDYAAGKSGDFDAALRTAARVVTPEAVDAISLIDNPIVVGVLSIEASGRNRVPFAAASVMANAVGAELDTEIVQSTSPKRTQMDGLGRIFSRPMFDGRVEPGRNYVLVDDTITQGGTFAALADHIEGGGGKVASIIALSGKQYGAIISVDPATISSVRQKFGDLENDFQKATGYNFDQLTQSEARYLANYKPAAAVRDRIAAEAGQAGRTEGQEDPGLLKSRDRTDTPEFKAWFGDSKVVDENGQPLVVYHGTSPKPEYRPFPTNGITEFATPSWFGPIKVASEYGINDDEAQVYPVYLSLQNPLITKDYDLASDGVYENDPRLKGHDGVMLYDRNDNLVHAVAFRPEQIKSAIGNNGQFNPANPDIRKSIDRTDTPEFKAWFGDSKVVDAAGSPLIVYHGSSEKGIAVFESEDGRFYFTDSKSVADKYGRKRGARKNAETYAVYLSMQNPEVFDMQGESWYDQDVGSDVYNYIMDAMEDGRDGVILENFVDGATKSSAEPSTIYVVFKPEQIKSATDNEGTFDPANPNIRKSADRPWFEDLSKLKVSTNYQLGDLLKSSKKLSWWDRTVGTQYNLATKQPEFKRVFDAVQSFINDVSAYATRAADLAPSILPKLDGIRDILKKPLALEDVKALRDPVFGGTLNYMRDENGELVETDDVQKAGVVFTDAELRGKFSLNDRQIGLYREFRDATDRSLTDLALSDMIRYLGSDGAEIRDQVMASGNVDVGAGVIDSHLSDLAAKEPGRRAALEATIDAIKQKADQANGLMDRGYAPLSRFGQYTVYAVGKGGEQLYFGMFETQRDANKMAREMADQYPDAEVTTGTMSQESYKLFSGVTPETLALFGESLGLEENGIDPKSEAFQTYLKLAKTNRSAMKRLIQRKGIDGFSEDAGRVLAGFVYSNARQVSTNLNAGEIGKAASDIKDGDVKDHAIRLMQYIQNPTEEAQKLKALLFTVYLGGNISSALVNISQTATTTFPYLSQFDGTASVIKRLGEAAKLAVRGIRNDEELKQALKRAEDEGVVSPQEVFALMAQAQGKAQLQSGDGTKVGDALAKTNNFMTKTSLAWGRLFSAAEQANRRIAFIAAYKLARDKGMENPFAFAEKTVLETQFSTNKGIRPAWARGAVGGVLFTFKGFTIAYLELLGRMLGNGPEGKKAFALALGTLFLFAGAGGLPGMDDLDDVIDGFAQRVLGKSFDSKQAKKEFFASILGQSGAEFVMGGISSLPGAPIDVSGRLGLGNIVPGTGIFPKKSNYQRDVMEVLGPAGSLFSSYATAVGLAAQGEVGKAAATAAPVGLQNAIKGMDMAAMGFYRDTRGRKVIDTNGWEALAKSMGFQPANVKRIQDATSTQQGLIAQNKMRESEIADKMARARIERKPDLAQEAREELAEWNRKNPGSPISIDQAQINKRVIEANKSKAQRIAATAPREIRGAVERELSSVGQ
jgi:hypothetical protein